MDFIVRDFIETAAPVPSAKISRNDVLATSPATVRNIMAELDEDGFLEQPHTSAGRIPTDKGYRYFINHLMGWQAPPAHIRHFFDEWDEPRNDFFDEVNKMLSQHLQLFSVIASVQQQHHFLQHGLAEVLKNPEFHELRQMISFAQTVETIESNVRKFRSRTNEPEISIEEFGIVSASFDDSEWGECIMLSLGPKRMNYEKARSIIKYARDKLDKE